MCIRDSLLLYVSLILFLLSCAAKQPYIESGLPFDDNENVLSPDKMLLLKKLSVSVSSIISVSDTESEVTDSSLLSKD